MNYSCGFCSHRAYVRAWMRSWGNYINLCKPHYKANTTDIDETANAHPENQTTDIPPGKWRGTQTETEEMK